MYDPADMPLPVRRPHEQDGRPDHFQGAARRNVEESDDEWRRAKAFYYGMVSLADSQIGRILDALDDLGLAEQTMVVCTSDHGEALGDHYVTGKGPTNYDCIVRVPLIARWPGAGSGLPANRAISGLAEHVDVAPTLLEAAGVSSYPGMKGQSLLPLARGETDQGRPNVLIEFRDVKTGFSVKTVRSRDYKYTRSRRNGETAEVFFDLRHDPDEFDDVAGDSAHTSALEEMRCRLLDRLQDAEDDLPQPTGIW
jgi:arylsulfatase A-like enzyme